MPDRAVTVGEVEAHAQTLSALASSILTGLASGEYDREVAFTERMLTELGVVFPPARMAERGLEVPESNSRYDPATGEFL